MQATTRKLLTVQTTLWEMLPSLDSNPDKLDFLRELAWLELEIRTELRTHQIAMILGSDVSHQTISYLSLYNKLYETLHIERSL